MINSSIVNNIKTKYIDDNLESSKLVNYTDLTNDGNNGFRTVLYKDLPKTKIEGYPFASDYVTKNGKTYSVAEYNNLDEKTKKSCELRFYYLPYSHELYIGTTGSGKTTGCVEPQLRAISSQKNKPNIFLTDPKGELFNRNAKHLQDQGYTTFVLNFKDLTRSDRWNPLFELYDTKIKVKNLGKDLKVHFDTIKPGLEIMGTPELFNDGYIEYDGKAFPNAETCENYIKFQNDFLEATIDSLLNQLVNMMIKVQSKQDATWELGAQDLLKGLVQCMLEDAIDPTSGFTRDMMTFRTIQQYYLALKGPIVADITNLPRHWLMKNKSEKVKALMSTALNNAPNTMRSYCGVFDSSVKDWFQGHIFALTTGNTIELDNIGDKPFAIFLITRDYEKSDFLIAGLFIDWVYRQMLVRAEKTKNPRALHFLLDEFGNIPRIKDLENKIATSRSRNIWFHLVVQSYSQINNVYDIEGDRRCSDIIKDNCNAQIFLGAQNIDTRETFSKQCGSHYIPTLESKLDPNNNSIWKAPLIPVSSLDQITPGQMYIKRLYMPVITSQFIRSYICAEHGDFKNFIDADGLLTCTPLVIEPFSSEKYTFKKLSEKPGRPERPSFDNFDF